ncbi:MAG: VOC family protein [Planctomycetes bacterium]|nr:VOC family protein [Planctomycetota bacterium]
MTVKPVPDGYHSVTPYLFIAGAKDALEFYARAFGAEELLRIVGPGGVIGHAEIKIGDSPIMLADEYPVMNCKGPHAYGGTPVCLMVYVADVDEMFARALAAGAKELRPLADQFYGDRTGTLVDPFGHVWTLATHKEHVPPAELQRRADQWAREHAQA